MKSMEFNMDQKGSVLVVDDEKNIVTVLKAILEKRDFTVSGFSEPRQALDALRKEHFDAVITDLYMPEIDGMAFLAEVNRLYPSTPVIMITAFGTVDSAVDAIKKGAFDYVTKPFEQSEIVSVVQKAVNTSRLKNMEGASANDMEPPRNPLLVGKGAVSNEVQTLLKKVAATPSTVLLIGETGSGKEILAEEIHRFSDRSFQALMKVHCAASSVLTIDQELFGSANKPGRLELADKGTLFIDEISELSADLQLRFFEFLESGKFENPINGEVKSADVRVIASSHKDLAKEVKEGHFREDLFYKLNVIPFRLPSLQERKEDLPELTEFFIRKLNKRLHKNYESVDASAMDIFQSAAWPGNLRQLEHVIEHMMLMGGGRTLTAKDLPTELRSEIDVSTGYDSSRFREIIKRQTQNLEKDLIDKALHEMDGNITKTAEHLGISRKGLQLKMKELGIK